MKKSNYYLLVGFFLLIASFSRAQTVDFVIDNPSGCLPLSVNYTNISTSGGGKTIASYQFLLSNGVAVSNVSPVGENLLNAGTYPIKLTVFYTDGTSESITKDVVVHPKPVADFIADDISGCPPFDTRFQDLSTTETGTIVNWQWNLGAGGSSDQNPTYYFPDAGSYNVSLIVTNNWGCKSEAMKKTNYINVFDRPKPSFTVSNNTNCDGAPLTVVFNNTTMGTGSIQYEWDFGDGTTSTEANPIHQYTSTGIFQVKLLARVGMRCADQAVSTVNTSVYIDKPTVDFTIPASTCSDETINLSAQATPAESFDGGSVKWIISDGTVKSGRNQSHQFAAAGTYTIRLEVTNAAGCTGSIEKTIEIKESPTADFSVPKSVFCSAPATVDFIPAVIDNSRYTYEWNFGDGSTSTDASPTHTYTTPTSGTGHKTVILKVTDKQTGCSATVTKRSFIKIQVPTIRLSIPTGGCKPMTATATAVVSNWDKTNNPLDKYVFDFGDGTVVDSQNPSVTHVFLDSGVFNAKVTLYTVDGCVVTANAQVVTVLETCDDPSIIGGGSDDGDGGGGSGFDNLTSCANPYEVVFTSTFTNSVVLQWNFGDGTIIDSAVTNPYTHIYNPANGKVYDVVVKVHDTTTNQIKVKTRRIKIVDEKANFTVNYTNACTNQPVQFYTIGIDSSLIKKYEWDFGDSKTTTINNTSKNNNGNTSHVYMANGAYTIILTITDSLDCSNSFSLPVTVSGPEADFIIPTKSFCGDTVLVEFLDKSIANGATPIVKWTWNFGDGSPKEVRTDSLPFTHRYVNRNYYTSYNVTLEIEDAMGCTSSKNVLSALEIYKPTADFSSPNTVQCGTLDVQFRNQSKGRNAKYYWDFGDSTKSTTGASSFIHTYPDEGTYTVKLIVVDEFGCSDTIVKDNYIQFVRPKAIFDILNNNQCAPAVVNIDERSEHASQWEWDFGDGGSVAYDRTPAPYIYDVPGAYTIRLIITSTHGCRDTTTQVMQVNGPMGIFAAPPTQGCKPLDYEAEIYHFKNVDLYRWDFGDGTPVQAGTDQSKISHTYTRVGKFLPNVILRSAEGCVLTLVAPDTVYVDSVKSEFIVDKTLLCRSGKINFTNQSVTTDFSEIEYYEWDFGDGTTSNELNPEHEYLVSGNYSVKLNVRTRYGCEDEMIMPNLITISSPPVVALGIPNYMCGLPATPEITALLAPDTSRITWQWDFGNGQTDTAQNPVPPMPTYSTPGQYNISLISENSAGCADTVYGSITIYPIPTLNAGPDVSICRGESVQFNARGVRSYYWFPPESSSLSCDNCPNPIASPVEDVTYVVADLTDAGCGAKDTINVTVHQPFQVTVSPDEVICVGDQVQLQAYGASSFVWHPFTGLNNNTIADPIASPITTTRYGAIGADQYGCFNDTAYVLITVYDYPKLDVGPDVTILGGTSHTFDVTYSNDVTSIVWSPDKWLSCSYCFVPTATPLVTTTYMAKAVNAGNCETRDSVTIFVLCGNNNIFIPNTFTPNDDGRNDVFMVNAIGLNTIQKITIYDRWGRVAFIRRNFPPNDPLYGWDGTIDGKPAVQDVYIYQVEVVCEDGTMFKQNGNVALIR